MEKQRIRFDRADFELVTGPELDVAADRVAARPCLLVDPDDVVVRVGRGASLSLAVHYRSAKASKLEVELAEDAELSLAQCFTAEAFVETTIRQASGSRSRTTVVELGAADWHGHLLLAAPHASCEVDGLFLADAEEHARFDVRVEHRSSDCTSRSTVKGVASGEATGEFHGRVYVAPDAQRTDAQQTSRNIELSPTARIRTLPELEIYADDVKCSHGATVGQLDADAVYYMRQRGLSERQARRLQIAGFAADIVLRCPVEPFCAAVREAVEEKLEEM